MKHLNLKTRMFALAVSGSFVAATAANAAVYKAKWDPTFGDTLPELGWKGEAEFEIKENCFNSILSDGWVNNSGDCAGQVRINSASVELYDIEPSNGISDSVFLAYGASQSPSTLRMWVDYVSATDKRVIAVEGSYNLPVLTSESFAKLTGADNAGYFLSFNGNLANTAGGAYTPEKAYTFLKSCSYFTSSQGPQSCSSNDSEKYPAVMTIVPEPEGYLLGLASLAVVGVWSRRRRPAGT